MDVQMRELYLFQGGDIRKAISKGEYCKIDFSNIRALSYSSMKDLKDLIVEPNVELQNVSEFIMNQLKEFLGELFTRLKVSENTKKEKNVPSKVQNSSEVKKEITNDNSFVFSEENSFQLKFF